MQEPDGSNQEVDMLGIPMTALHKTYNGDLGKMKADFAKKFAAATLEIKVRTQTAGCLLLVAGYWLPTARYPSALLPLAQQRCCELQKCAAGRG